MGRSIDDPNKDENTIIQKFMRELCRRDTDTNRNVNVNPDAITNVFNIREIQKKVLLGVDLDKVVDVLRGYEMIDDPNIELVDQERKERVRLTNTGRAHCGEFGL